jgi:hypothetical protein
MAFLLLGQILSHYRQSTHLDWRSGKDADGPETQDYSSVAALIWKHLSEKITMLSVVVQQFGKIEILPGSCDS